MRQTGKKKPTGAGKQKSERREWKTGFKINTYFHSLFHVNPGLLK